MIRADLALSLGDEAGARQFLAQSRVVMPGEAGLEVAADERRLLATLDAHLVTD